MADDEDVIYVDVVPRLDEKAADDAAKKLDDKFKDTGKNIGGHFKDAIKDATDHIGENIKGTFQDLEDHSKDFGTSLKEHIKGAGETISDILRSDTTRDISGKLVETLKDTVKSLKSEDISAGIGGLNTLLGGNVPILDQAQSLLDRIKESRENFKGFTSDAKDFLESFGGGALAGRFGAATESMAGPIAAAIAAVEGLNQFGNSSFTKNNSALNWAFGAPPPDAQDRDFHLGPIPIKPGSILSHLPGLTPPKAPLTGKQFVGPDGTMTFTGGNGNSWDTDPWFFPGQPAPPPSRLTEVPRGGAPASGGANVQAQSATVEAAAATITAGSLSLAGLSLPSGFSRAPSTSAPTTTGAKSWFSSGGVLPGSSPGHDNLLGSLGGAPIGLEGGEFVVNPRATQANLGLLQAINGGMMGFDDGGLVGSVLGGGTNVHQQPAGGVTSGGKPQSPGGIKGQLPGGVQSAPSQPLKSADEPSPPQTIIPQGKGKGFDISGGLLGTAEGAAAEGIGLAADAFAPGSGAAASQATQIATQEINRAISFGVKAATTAAVEAPLDTFWVSGSQLADPSHSWFGKLGLSLIGQTGGAIQNLAGQTQAPLTPGQGQGQSPLGGGQKTAGPAIHIENQYNGSDVDHEANNRSLMTQFSAYDNYK